MRSRLSQLSLPLIAALVLVPVGGATVASAADAQGQAVATKQAAKTKQTKKAKKKKKTTAQRVTALSRSLNRAKAEQREVKKQLNALVKQQGMIDEQLAGAVGQIQAVTDSAVGRLNAIAAAAAMPNIAEIIQDPASGIPQLIEDISVRAMGGLQALLASQEFAVAVVTVGEAIASPTLLISPDIPDIGAPVTFSGTVPVIVPPGLDNEPIHVRVGAVSLENDGTWADDPAFHVGLNHFSVTQDGFTGDIGDAVLRGGSNGVSRTHVSNGQVTQCIAGANGCGGSVWSGPNPDLSNLPYWPVTSKLVSFGDKPGVNFQLGRMVSLTAPGRLASLTNHGTPPIYVSTPAPRTGVALLKAEVSITALDLSVNPADPLA